MKMARKIMVGFSVLMLVIGLCCFSMAAETPKYGGTLNVALNDAIQTFNVATTHSGTVVAQGPLYDSLVTLDFDFTPKPQLAKSWTVSEDGLTYTFKLVENAKWHDGKSFTAADVKFTVEEILLKYHPSGAVMWGNVDRIDTPDQYTVVFKLKKKSALFMKALGPQTGKMMPKHLYEGTDILKNPANMKPIGTGPFKFVEYKTGSYAVYERNPDYWNPQQPYLDKIIMKCIVDESARLAALESGEVNLLPVYVPILEIARLQKEKRFSVTNSGYEAGLAIYMIKLNLRNKPLSDLKVRQAISHALDKDKMHQLVVYGSTPRSDGPFSRSIPGWYNENQMTYPYDPKKAERLLDEAGYPKGPDGIRFKIGCDMAAGHHGLIRLCEVARENLKAVGIDYVLQTHEMGSFVDKVYKRWESDTSHMAHGMQGDPNIGYARYLLTSQIKQLPFVNCGGYSNPKVDEAFEQAGMELDNQKRIKYWQIIQEECAKDIPIIWFWDMPSPSAWDSNFVGFPMGPSSWGENYANIWWKQGRDKK